MSAIQQALFMIGGFVAPTVGNLPEANNIRGNLVAWWPLNENAATPTFADVHGSNPLTQRNAAGTVNTNTNSGTTFVKGSSRAWNPNQVNDLAAFAPKTNTHLGRYDGDHTFGMWVVGNLSPGTTGTLIGNSNIRLTIDSSGSTYRLVAVDGTLAGIGTGAGINGNPGGPMFFITGTLNRAANQIEFRIFRPGFAMTKIVTAFPGALANVANSNFFIGEIIVNDTTFDVSNPRNAVFWACDAFFVDRAITDGEADYLYNNGAGRNYAQLTINASAAGGVSIYMDFEGANNSTTITDLGPSTWACSGAAKIQTAVPLVGTSSAILTGTDFISTPATASNMLPPTADFDLSFVARASSWISNAGVGIYLLSVQDNSVTAAGTQFAIATSLSSQLAVILSDGTTRSTIVLAGSLAINTTYEITVRRRGTTISLWANGSQIGSGTFTGSINLPAGRSWRIGYPEAGIDRTPSTTYIDNIRLIKY